jgi:hypothetical protein
MAYSIFSLTGRANPNILAEKLYRQQWKRNSFGLWVAPEFIKVSRDASDTVVPSGDGARFTGAPIEVFKQFITEGKTTLDIPVRLRLTGMPVYGDKVLKGNEEAARIAYRTVKINLTRKAYMKPSLMSAQVTLPYLENLMLQANDYLSEWWNDYHPGNFLVALTAGSSIDMLNDALIGGRAANIMSHPHFYVIGGAKVAWTNRPGTAAYETAVETAVNGANSSTTNALTVKRLQALVLEAQRQRISPILMKRGFRRFAIWLGDSQWLQLQQDTDFKEFYRRLPNELANHPLATGAVAEIAGAIIYVDQNMPHAATAANGEAGYTAVPGSNFNRVWYWPQPTAAEYAAGYKIGNMIERRCTLDRKIGFLVGESALSVGVGVPVSGGKKGPSMQFVEQKDDYGAINGVGIATVQSVFRADVFDHDGMVTGLTAGDFYENTSSLVFVSNSPDTLTSI